jgi:uncharacterized protein YfaQ (DUF2300 family)
MRLIRVSSIFAACLLLCGSALVAVSPALELAWQQEGTARYSLLSQDVQTLRDRGGVRLPRELTTSLGSLWKLFVYAYIAGKGLDVPEYVCKGSDVKAEAFCCAAGRSIGPDDALAQSCGLFFEPARLGITPEEWRAYWHPLLPSSALWLEDLSRLQPDTQVSVESLLGALAAIPPRTRLQTVHALSRLLFNGRVDGTLPYLGSRLAVKTWTWDSPEKKGVRVGGFAGWLSDGTPVWARTEGSSAQILKRWAPALSVWLDTFHDSPDETECVVVAFFTGYPVKELIDLETRRPAPPGVLDGSYRVYFRKGSYLKIRSHGELSLVEPQTGPRIFGRLGLNDYIARVLTREAAAEPVEAARALAVAARTYLLQNGAYRLGCYHIDDSSRNQRVSPNPTGVAAQRVAAWTDGLILKGVDVHYHSDRPSLNRLSWSQAIALAREGRSFDQILAVAYPGGSLGSMYAGVEGDCERMTEVEAWLQGQSRQWNRMLVAQAGFEAPPADLTVCRVKYGNPYSDIGRRRIYARGLQSSNDRIALAHEYLHLGFRWHSRGTDETFVESTARKLVGE